jgi:phosphoglycerate dehydrogenase-like enzyme
VFSVEPLPADHVLWDMENVMITPHCGGSALGNTRKNAELLEKNLRAYTDGKLDELIDRVR